MMQLQFFTYRISVERTRLTTAELVTSYDRLAEQWPSKVRRLGFDYAYHQLFQDLQAAGVLDGVGAETAVLDGGIGAGALTTALHAVQPCGWHLHGVDVAPRMMAKAEEELAARAIPHTLHQDSVCHLPFDDHTFHFAMTAHTLEHLSQPRTGLAEMVRVLQPGAPLLVIMTRRSWLSNLLDMRWGLSRTTPDHLRQMLTAEGLCDVRLFSLGGPPWCHRLSVAAVGWAEKF